MPTKSSTIIPQDIAQLPAPGWNIPSSFLFSPDNNQITYLYSPGRNLINHLYGFSIETGETRELVAPGYSGATEDNLSPEEKLRRERQRQMALGVSQYFWANKTPKLILPLQGGIFILDEPDQPIRQLVDGSQSPALDPQISPDDQWVAYVQKEELHVMPISGGEPRQLTFGAGESGKTHGLAEYIAQEEMARSHGFWWSPDSGSIAYTEVDETHIPEFTIVHQGQSKIEDVTRDAIRYPFAGQPNAIVRLGVVNCQDGSTTWLDLGEETDQYIARVNWAPDGQLVVQVENREQTSLELILFNLKKGSRSTLLVEKSDTWINLHDLFLPLNGFGKSGEPGFIWASEQTGYRHLYLYDGIGKLIRPLTSGEWMVDSVAAVDQESQMVYFVSTCESPLEAHLYAVSYIGEEPRQITNQSGMHTVIIDREKTKYIDICHSTQNPPRITLRSLMDNSELAVLFNEVDPRIDQFHLAPPALVKFTNRTGTTLYGALYLPPKEYGEDPHPLVILVYGGPHAQMVSNGWNMTSNLRAQYLRSLGFAVFIMDNRGSARRGLEFEGAIRHNLGHLEVEDQEDGIYWLLKQNYTRPGQVGICGWSYGGYMAARCLASSSGLFTAAVAGAPVTDWDGYDTHYTERYMGTPLTNPAGYQAGSLLNSTDGINGKLLIIHGLIDENVHFRHTARFIQALIAGGKSYELLLLPNARHSVRSPSDRAYLEDKISQFFLTHLRNGK